MNSVGEQEAVLSAPHEAAMHRSTWWWSQPVLLVLLIGSLYSDTFLRLVRQWWDDPNFSHGFFVPAFAAFVVWQRRKRLAALPLNPSWSGLLIIAASLMVLIVGITGAELFLSRSSFIFLLAGLIIYFLGWDHFRALIFPWALLFLMVPLPTIILNQITFPLQFLASDLASRLLSLAGVPVLREGNIIQLPTMSLEVVEACSGIRSLISLLTLSVIYGYLLESSTVVRILLVIAAIPIAVIANGLRIMGTGLVGIYWSPDKAQGFFHEFSGWVIFVLSLAFLFLIHHALRFLWRRQKGRTS